MEHTLHTVSYYQPLHASLTPCSHNFFAPLKHCSFAFLKTLCAPLTPLPPPPGVHRVVLKVWEKRASPYFQLIDFCFALGAFIAPLLAQPFLIQQQDCNTTTISCNDTVLDPVNGSWCDDVKCLLETCTNLNSTTNLHDAIHNCTDWSFLPLSPHVPMFAWAYVIAVIPWLCALLPLAFISATADNFRCVSSCLTHSHTPSSLNTNALPPSTPHSGWYAKGFHKLGMCTARTAVIYFIAFLLISIYYGLSCGYGGLVFTFAVETLHFSKMEASNLNSLFYGAFAAGSVASIILVLLKVPLGLLIILNVTGSLVSTLLMVTYPSNPILIWLGTGGLGASMASIYGTMYGWLTGQVPMNGMGTAILIAAVSVADMTHATILGALLEHATPYLLLYYALGDVVVSCGIVAALLGTSHLWKSAEVVVAMETTRRVTESDFCCDVDKVDGKISYQCDQHGNACSKRSKVIMELTSEPYRSPMGVLCSP